MGAVRRFVAAEGAVKGTHGDAKRYFCFFLDPGCVTFKRLWEELQKNLKAFEVKRQGVLIETP